VRLLAAFRGQTRKFSIGRRDFLFCASGTILGLSRKTNLLRALSPSQVDGKQFATHGNSVFVATSGDDRNPGTESFPLKTFLAAQSAILDLRKRNTSGPLFVFFREGIYYLEDTIVFNHGHSGEPQSPIEYLPYPGEHVILSGGTRLVPQWTHYRDGILQTPVPPGTDTDQLFVNGQQQILARYPNYDPNAKYLNGSASDAIDPERAKRWANPKGGYIHALHQYLWGDQHYVISGKDASGNVTFDGGWQNNRPRPMHAQYRFVENIFEELDSPGEWFLNKETNTLYFYPPVGLDLNTAVVETVRLKHLVEFHGTPETPVKNVGLSGFTFRHASRTFMETREPLLRSDWRIYRGGAVLFAGAEDCYIRDCTFDQLGGNCIFVSNYNRRIHISGCHLVSAGASGICFVGDPKAVRNPLESYEQRHAVDDLDLTPGPLTNNYPEDCLVEDTLIYRTGRVEKQSAPVEIDMAKSITVRHASIYDVPRAGINIGDGCWGGHHIDSCDVFDTVKETGDHGSFNSWARDRWWGVTGVDLDSVVEGKYKALPTLDAMQPNVLSNSRWRCDHGWDIDLDDGSSNYHIYNNLCLNGGLKLREGFYRICENNVLVNNTLHPHVWYNDSHDIFRSNIVFSAYRPIGMRAWTQEIDFNLLHRLGNAPTEPAKALQQRSSQDIKSLQGDAEFVNAADGDYRVKPDSPAYTLGFVNFNMQDFGVQSPRLKAISRQPELPSMTSESAATANESRSRRPIEWAGAKARNIVGMDEVSAKGTPGETGVVLLEVPETSAAGMAGCFEGDVILAINGKPIKDIEDILAASGKVSPAESLSVTVLRFQQESTIKIQLN
jgi:hypothetical protein